MIFWHSLGCAIFAMGLIGYFAPSQAQTAVPGFASSIKNRVYLEERWLGGTPEKMLEQFNDALLLMPLMSVELTRKKALSDAEKQTIRDGVKAQRKVLNVQAPNSLEMRAQFDVLRTCLEEDIPKTLEKEKLAALTEFIDTGVHRDFPVARALVSEWLVIALRRHMGIGVPLHSEATDALIYKDKQRLERLKRLQDMYFAISDAGMSLMGIHDALGADIALAMMGELRMMSEELPVILKVAGMSDAAIAVLDIYSADGVNGVYAKESSVFESCMKKPSVLLSPLRTYAAGSMLATQRFFELSPHLLSVR